MPTGQTSVPMSINELFRQQEGLGKRAQELQSRQQELKRRQQQTAAAAFVPVEPCFCQDIDVDPVQFQETVRVVYYVYIVYKLALVANAISFLTYMISGGGIGIFFLAIIPLILFTECSYLFWFLPVYKALRGDSSFIYMVFFVLFFHSISCLVQALGLSSEVPIFTGLLMLVAAVAFTAAFFGMAFALLKEHRLCRGALHYQEGAQAICRRRHVRSQCAAGDRFRGVPSTESTYREEDGTFRKRY